jgi:Carboxypeptidase regulatory-like domain
MRTVATVVLGLAAACATAFAQSSTGTLTGIITDPSQANLAGVALELVNEETGVGEHASTNQQGEYTFPLLPPGHYRLTAQAKGFRAYTHPGIVMESARVSRLDIAMQLGQVTETIEVMASTPLLESESSTVGQFIEHKTVVDMPLTGRRVGELLAAPAWRWPAGAPTSSSG